MYEEANKFSCKTDVQTGNEGRKIGRRYSICRRNVPAKGACKACKKVSQQAT